MSTTRSSSRGRVSRGSIGVGFKPNEKPETLKVYGAKQGVFVTKVEPSGPGDKAGVKVEDVIIALNGQARQGRRRPREPRLRRRRWVRTPRSRSCATAARWILKVTDRRALRGLGQRSAVPQFRREETEPGETTTQVKFGVSIQNLTQGLRDRMGFEEKGGVLVTGVTPDSFAEDVGVVPRDIIIAINRQPVSFDRDDVQRIQAKLKPGDAVAFRVMRGGAAAGRAARADMWQSFFAAGTLLNRDRKAGLRPANLSLTRAH